MPDDAGQPDVGNPELPEPCEGGVRNVIEFAASILPEVAVEPDRKTTVSEQPRHELVDDYLTFHGQRIRLGGIFLRTIATREGR